MGAKMRIDVLYIEFTTSWTIGGPRAIVTYKDFCDWVKIKIKFMRICKVNLLALICSRITTNRTTPSHFIFPGCYNLTEAKNWFNHGF